MEALALVLKVFGGSIIPPLLAALAALITKELIALMQKLAAKTSSKALQDAMGTLQGFAVTSVQSVEQTVVASLQAKGEWGNPDTYKQALTTALANAKTMTSAALPQLAASLGSDLDSVLTSLIEAEVLKAGATTNPVSANPQAPAITPAKP